MKKYLVFMAFMVMCSISAFADINWGGYFNGLPTCVQLYSHDGNDYGDHPVPHRGGDPLPAFAYEGNTFVVAVPNEIEDVTIVIRDEDGVALYYDVVSSITDYYMFQLTDGAVADMFSIEIYYGDTYLYGEF